MSRPLTAFVLPVVVCAVAGCGGSGSSAKHRQATASEAVTEARALAFANAVNLTAADLPGATATEPAKEEGFRPNDVTFARCSGGVNPSMVVLDRDSAKLKTGASEVRSSAVVYPSSALAAQNFDAARSARGQACLRRLLPQALKKESTSGASRTPPTISILPSRLPGQERSFGIRTAIGITTAAPSSRSRRVFIDVNDIQVGPAEVNLTVDAFDHPPAARMERQLLELLFARAHSHEL